MKTLLLALFAILGFQQNAFCGETDEIFTVFLVRHAEKATASDHSKDPALSPCGESRAVALAEQLQSVNLEHVFSTAYNRTLSTARPVAASHSLEIETYDPSTLEEFSDQLLLLQQNALVVGHSNTTAVLAGLLSGEEGEAFDEDEYDRLYLVAVSDRQKQVNLLDQAFRCLP